MNLRAWLGSLLPRTSAQAGIPANAAQEPPAAGVFQEARAAFDAGLAAYAAQDFPVAIDCFNRALKIRHDDADAHNNLGLSYLSAGRAEDATDAFVLALHFRPDFPQAFYNMALAALAAREVVECVRCLERALKLNPDYAAAHNTLGYLLTHQTGDFERGAGHVRAAMQLSPEDPDVLCNYSAVLAQEGRAAEALELCESLLASHPAMHEARLNRALALLKLGRFGQAWPDYEARKLARGNYVPRALPFPEWQGEPLPAGRLLIYAEQGLGDQIMFASCVPDALKLTGGCLVECAPALAPLFARSFEPAEVVAQTTDDNLVRSARVAGVTCQVAIGSLPSRFRQCRADFSAAAPYLRAAPARRAYWKDRLSALGAGIKVGISWSGGALSTRGASRSLPLAEWAPILCEEQCHFVSLQYGDAAGQINALPATQRSRLHDWREAIENFDETAALVDALDLVITVQTALVHLAGALGKPAWVMVPAACEWRYGEGGATMPWYPTVRLLRQTRPGEWHAVIERIAHDLLTLAPR